MRRLRPQLRRLRRRFRRRTGLLAVAGVVVLAAVLSISAGTATPTGAQECTAADGSAECLGWTFDYYLSGSSITPTGLTMRNVYFEGESMLYQAHFAALPVKYDGDACGPYIDLFSTLTNAEPLGIRGDVFTQDDVTWLEVGSHYQIGSYVLYTSFYFSDLGEMKMRMFARGLQCNVHHVHYPMLVLDIDADGIPEITGSGFESHGLGDEIWFNDQGAWVQQDTETDNDVTAVGHEWIVRDANSGTTVAVNYDAGIFDPPSGGTFDPFDASNNRVYTRQSNGPAELAWLGAAAGEEYLEGGFAYNNAEWAYNDGETITDPVIVVRGFLDHAVGAELPDDWHTSGISVEFVGDPFAAPPSDVNQLRTVVTCLAGNGRIDVNVVNESDTTATFEQRIGDLNPRVQAVPPQSRWRSPVTGRPEGPLHVTVLRDGEVVLDEMVVVDCDDDSPVVSSPEVQYFTWCVGGNGMIFAQMANPTESPRSYILSVDSIRRSTTAAAFGAAFRGISGRPNGSYDVSVSSGGETLSDAQVEIAC